MPLSPFPGQKSLYQVVLPLDYTGLQEHTKIRPPQTDQPVRGAAGPQRCPVVHRLRRLQSNREQDCRADG